MLDKLAIKKLRDLEDSNESGFLNKTIELFLQVIPHRFSEIQSALDQNLLHLLDFQMHSMKSTCATLGAMKMFEICEKIENISDPKWNPIAKRLFEELKLEYEIVKKELKAVIDNNEI